MMKELITHSTNRAVAIDAFLASSKSTLESNLSASHIRDRIEIISGWSTEILPKMTATKFDVIYVDGGHSFDTVLQDALLSWPLLKLNGIIIFDDYLWGKWQLPQSERPQKAIDYFMKLTKNKFVLLQKGPQVFLKKISDEVFSFIPPSRFDKMAIDFILPMRFEKKISNLNSSYYSKKFAMDSRYNPPAKPPIEINSLKVHDSFLEITFESLEHEIVKFEFELFNTPMTNHWLNLLTLDLELENTFIQDGLFYNNSSAFIEPLTALLNQKLKELEFMAPGHFEKV